MSAKGKVFLIPNTLSDGSAENVLPANLSARIAHIRFFVVENPKSARRLLVGLGLKPIIDESILVSFKPELSPEESAEITAHLKRGNDVGVISDAGCPGIADPGQEVVKLAHDMHCRVIPITGPSSVTLALMASGFNGQQFAFHGYLPVDQGERKKTIREIERRMMSENQTQIFIETPYRNHHLLTDLLSECQKKTKICLAVNLTLSDEWIRVDTVENWKKNKPDIQKKQCLFLIYK